MIKRLLFAIAVIIAAFMLIECKESPSDPVPSPEEQQLQKLAGTWNLSSVTNDGIAQPGYENFKLVLAGTPGASTYNYSCTGRPALSPWPANGTWKFGTDPLEDITIDNDLPALYELTSTQLAITFNYSGNGFGGRVSEVKGQWVFKFTK